MIEKIVFSLIAFVLFVYIFLFKMIRKNDTSYLIIVLTQALGILMNFIQIFFGILTHAVFYVLIYLLCIVFPIVVLIIESRGFNFNEIFYSCIARFFIVQGNNKKAKSILINIVSKYNESYIGHKMLAEIYEKEGGMRKAIDEYVKVLDIRKNDYKSYYKISVLLKDLGKKDEAIQMLKKLVKQKPDFDNGSASNILGEMLYEKENFKEAITVYSNVLKLVEGNALMYYNLGLSYSRMNEFSLAKKAYEKTIEADDKFYYAYYRLAQISLLYRDFDSAEHNFIKAASEEYEAKAYYELAKIYILKNKKEKAIIYINKAIENDSQLYEKTKNEPILFCLKNQIIKKEETKNENPLSKKEIEIEEYLNNTYNITKKLNADRTNENIKKFKWEK